MGERTLISAENEAVKIRIRYHADIDRVKSTGNALYVSLMWRE